MSNTSKKTSIALMKIYHIFSSYLDGDVQSEEAYATMVQQIDELAQLVPEEEMAEIYTYVEELSDLVYDDDIFADCYAPDCGHFEETESGYVFHCDTLAQAKLACLRYMTIIAGYRESLDALAEHVMIPLMIV